MLTDPPYGIGASGAAFVNGNRQRARPAEYGNWDESIPSGDCFIELFKVSADQVIWGANYFLNFLRPSRCFLVWDKTLHGNSYADCELAWTSFDANARIKRLNMVATNMDGRCHPTQKPKALMRWCLSFAPNAETILDPFMGSGTTLRAAKDLGRKAIGIEIEERYCEIAANRLRQEVFQFA